MIQLGVRKVLMSLEQLVCVNAWGRVELRINFHAYFQSFHKIARVAQRREQFVKALKIQVNIYP